MATTIKGWPQGLLTDNVTDLLSEPTLAQAVEDDVFGAAGVLAAHCVFVYRTADSGTIPGDGSTNQINFTAELIDTDGYHTSTNSSLIVPTGLAGYYVIGGSARWDSQANGNYREIWHTVNGTRINGSQQTLQSNQFAGSTNLHQSIVGFAHLAVADTVELNFHQDSGSGIVIKAAGNTPNLWAVRLPFS